jgi:ureidoglycolate lyase
MAVLVPTPSTPELLAPYGELVLPVPNGSDFGVADVSLTLEGAPPRFWAMAADHREPMVTSLARHLHCTQCLASAEGKPWWMVLAPPQPELAPPDPALIRLFRIEPGVILKLHRGTWHAGPYFPDARAGFFLLELQNTNSPDFTGVALPETLRFGFAAAG